jgi:hypothetical protein
MSTAAGVPGVALGVRHTGAVARGLAGRPLGAHAARRPPPFAAFRRSGDPHLLESASASDLRFRMAGRVERRGRDCFAARLAHDFEFEHVSGLTKAKASDATRSSASHLTSPPNCFCGSQN